MDNEVSDEFKEAYKKIEGIANTQSMILKQLKDLVIIVDGMLDRM